MSRLPEFMSQVHVKRFGSSVILIILRLFSFPELTLILLSGSVKDINSSKQTCFENFDDS